VTGFSGEVAAKSCDLTGSNLIIKGGVMALQKGESYRCPDPDSGCENRVTKGPKSGGGGNENPRCCGKEMQKI
jgi:hypothetical protein